MSAIQDLVDNAIKENTVTIFSKTWCQYSAKAKALLTNYPGIDKEEVKIFELDKLPEGPEIQEYLYQKTKQQTVPNVFIKQQHIGGSDDLAKFEKKGKLAKLIAA